jgi:hypothetical protein
VSRTDHDLADLEVMDLDEGINLEEIRKLCVCKEPPDEVSVIKGLIMVSLARDRGVELRMEGVKLIDDKTGREVADGQEVANEQGHVCPGCVELMRRTIDKVYKRKPSVVN